MSDSPPESWYNPPYRHEICVCFDCHDGGVHDDEQDHWSRQGCEFCENELYKEQELRTKFS